MQLRAIIPCVYAYWVLMDAQRNAPFLFVLEVFRMLDFELNLLVVDKRFVLSILHRFG